MYKKIILIFILITTFCISGCGKSEAEVFAGVEDAADWSLTPLLDNYHIWLDDVVDYPKMETEREPIDICYISDTNSRTHYLITLTYVWNGRVNG